MQTLKHATYGVDLSNNSDCGLGLQELEVVCQKEFTFQL